MSHDRTATIGRHPEDTGPPRFPDRWLAARLERLLATVDVRVQLWDGQSSWTSSGRPIGSLVIGDRRTLLGLIVNPELLFGEASRERAAREGLSDRVEFIEDDYRSARGCFDAFVSVGMLEHVGRRRFRDLGEVLRRTIRRDGGRGLLHFIGRDTPRPLNAWIRRRIFPGAYPPTLTEVMADILTPSGMSVLDVENLRLHYAHTLAHWGQRFEAVADQVRTTYGDEFRRAWELYLAGSEASFATGWLQLFQVVFAPGESAPPFWTRAELYADQT